MKIKTFLIIVIVIAIFFIATREKAIITHKVIEINGVEYVESVIIKKSFISTSEGLKCRTQINKGQATNHQVVVNGVVYPSTKENIEMVKKGNEKQLRKLFK